MNDRATNGRAKNGHRTNKRAGGSSTISPRPTGPLLTGPDLLETVGTGFFSWKGPPCYGSQDLGYSPGGVQDRFSFHTGQILLGTDTDTPWPALEMIHPPRLVRFRLDCCFVLTGGKVEAGLDRSGDDRHRGSEQDQGRSEPDALAAETTVEQAVVYHAPAGSELRFRRRVYGFRTYLSCRPAPPDPGKLAGRSRGPYHRAARWPHPAGRIRVIAGPEITSLADPEAFLGIRWRTSGEMSDMGIRLEPARDTGVDGSDQPGSDRFNPDRAMQVREEQLISAPVCDGTIQMTPSGPIALLRERQTTGGYPRVAVVVGADVDMLVQMGPGRIFSFLPVTLEEALIIGRQWRDDLKRLGERFPQ